MQPNNGPVFEQAAPGRAAKLTVRLKVTLIPHDPSANRTAPNSTIRGTSYGPLPPARLANGAAYQRRFRGTQE